MTADVLDLLEAAEMLGHNLPPVSGGYLNQTASFIDALRCLRSEEAGWRKQPPAKDG